MTQPDTNVTADTCGCSDFQASRRSFIKGLMGASAGAVGVTMFGDTVRQAAFGGTADTNVLVVVSMRGGADSLSIVVPYTEGAYYSKRPSISVPADRLWAKDGGFGLHPALQPLQSLWNGNKLTAVLATGLRVPNRSHFAAMEAVEDADPGSPERRGWINRMIGLDAEHKPQEAVALGTGIVPTSMWGSVPTLSSRKVDNLDLPGIVNPEFRRRKVRSLHQVWDKADGPLGRGARTSLTTASTMSGVASKGYAPANGAKYPVGKLGDALEDSARLIKARLGVEIISIDHGSFDMHNNLGPVESTGGVTMTGMLKEFAAAVAAFFTDLGAMSSKVTLMTITEFGRRVTENGNGGLDHGWATAMMVVGAGVRGGRYYGQWPGLSPADLVDGDLKVTTDYRSVVGEVLRKRFNVSTGAVFPGFTPENLGFMA